MPLVLTDYKNETWCTEQMTDGYLHAGYTGQAGPRLQDLLDFAGTRQTQFESFVEKRQAEEVKSARTNQTKRRDVRTRNSRDAEVGGVE